MHATFKAHHAVHDALEILVGRLDVGAFTFRQVQLVGFAQVARIELVGHGDRHDPDARDQLPEALRFLPVGKPQHLEQSRIGAIEAVLGSTFALRNPDRFPRLERLPDEVGRSRERGEDGSGSTDLALDHEAFVKAHQVSGERAREQVVPHGDVRRSVPCLMNRVVQNARVHHDVPMIGDEQIRLARRQMVQAVHRQLDYGLFDEAGHVSFEKQLNVVDGDQAPRLAPEIGPDQGARQARPRPGQPGHQVDGGRPVEFCVFDKARNHAGDLRVPVRSNRFEVHHGRKLAPSGRQKTSRRRAGFSSNMTSAGWGEI